MAAIIFILAVLAIVVYFFTPWLNSISFVYFGAIFACAGAINLWRAWLKKGRSGLSLTNEFSGYTHVLTLVFLMGCAALLNWPDSRLGGGILFVLAVVSWTMMIAKEIN